MLRQQGALKGSQMVDAFLCFKYLRSRAQTNLISRVRLPNRKKEHGEGDFLFLMQGVWGK